MIEESPRMERRNAMLQQVLQTVQFHHQQREGLFQLLLGSRLHLPDGRRGHGVGVLDAHGAIPVGGVPATNPNQGPGSSLSPMLLAAAILTVGGVILSSVNNTVFDSLKSIGRSILDHLSKWWHGDTADEPKVAQVGTPVANGADTGATPTRASTPPPSTPPATTATHGLSPAVPSPVSRGPTSGPSGPSGPAVPGAAPAARISYPSIRTAQADTSTKDAIRQGAAASGQDYSLLYAIAGAESSFRSNVSASSSTAVGLGQFTEGSWTYLVKQFKLPYTLQDRNDPAKSMTVAGLYVAQIKKKLQNTLGREPTYGEIYMGYFLGPGGASNFFTAMKKDPTALAAPAFPSAAHANPNVFYAGGDVGRPLTFQQVLDKQEGKIQSYAADANPRQDQQAATAAQASTPLPPAVKGAQVAPSSPSISSPGPTPAVAVPQPGSPGVALPSAEITNQRIANRNAVQQAVNQGPPGTETPDHIATVPGPTPTTTQPLRDKNGRLTQV